MEKLRIKGGALIIGSLLWQDDLKIEDKDQIRKKWRDEHLVEDSIKVKLPIRYGRLSGDGIFTMVFSKNCEKDKTFGTGFIKKFKVEYIDKWEDLENQTIEMSRAEGMNGSFIGGKKNIWSTMSILFNPSKINHEKRNYLTKKWKNKIVENGGGFDYGDYKFGNEESAIKDDCSLNLEWFEAVSDKDYSNLNELDFIICTVTKHKNPETNDYPTTSKLARSIEQDEKRKYFKNNVTYGISTYEDNLIESRLEK
jgi:hypothetical protein